MGLFDTLLEAYVAPERAAYEEQQRQLMAPQRTADAWSQVMSGLNAKPNVPEMIEQRTQGISPIGTGGLASLADNPNVSGVTSMAKNPQFQKALQEAEDPLNRWKKQINLMMQSGNSTLQNQAMGMMSDYQKRATAPQASSEQKWSDPARRAIEIGLKPGTKEFRNFVERATFKKNYAEPVASASDSKTLIYPNREPVIAGTPMSEVYKRGALPKADSGETTKMAQLEGLNYSIGKLDDLFEGSDINFDDQLSGLVANFRTSGNMVGDAADYLLNQAGERITPDQAEYISHIKSVNSQMLNLLSGAAATDTEYDRVRSQLPQLGQGKELFESNMKKTKENFRILSERWNKSRGAGINISPNKPDKPKPPTKTNNDGLPEGYTWVED